MKIIGICGGSGSGKSTVSRCFAALGGAAFDTDAIYHELVDQPSPCVTALREAFGDSIINDGHIDRGVLRTIVFSDEEKRETLNRISHRFVMDEVRRRIKEAEKTGFRFAVIDAPLLLEAGADEDCDLVVAVIADEKERVRRIMKRDGITEEQALERIRHQLSDEELKSRCDTVLYNNGSTEEISEKCEDLLKLLGIPG